MKYAAAYIRVSDERQDEFSPDSQLKLIKEYAIQHGYDIPPEYVFYDDGISAKGSNIEKRISFNNMIAFAKEKSHPVDAIFVWKFSRFARNQEQSIVFKNLLRKNNVDVISVSEPIGDDMYGSLIERIIEWMDEFYLIRLSGEVKRGMTERASRGLPISVAPFGYKLIDKKLYPDENANCIKYIFKAYNNGMGVRQIAVNLQSQGIKTRRGNPPDNRFVEYILQNPVYNGKIRWCKDGRASSSRYNNKNMDVMIVDGEHEAIIDDETFNITQELLLKQKQRYGKYRRREQPVQFMLKGLIRCDCCHATLVYVASKSSPSVQCHNYAKGKCKASHSISIAKANKAVIEFLEQVIQKVEFKIVPKENEGKAIIDYDSLIQKEKEKLRRASDAYDDGIDSIEEYKRKKRSYQNSIDKLVLEKEKAACLVKNEISYDFVNKVKDVVEFIKLPSVSEEEKNRVLRTIIHHIDYEKQKHNLHIYFHA